MAQSRRRNPRNRRNTAPRGSTPGSAERQRYELWVARVARARKLREDWEQDYQVTKCGEFFLGKQTDDRNDRVMNHFHATIKVIKPNLVFQHPKFYVRPKPGKVAITQRSAAIGEGLMEAISSQDDHLTQVSALGAMQSFFRVGVLKVCYEPYSYDNPEKGQPIYRRERDGEGGRTPDRNPMTGEELREPDTIVSDEVYRYKWVDAKYLLLPDEGPDMTSWSWVGEEITVTLSEAKADERFPAERRRQLQPNVADSGARPSQRGESSDEEDAKFRYIELYDIDHHERKIYAEDQTFDGFLLEDETPAGIEDHPYAILAFNEIIEPEPSPWPLPLVYPWLDVQAEYNIKRRQVTEGGKRSARKILYSEGTFDDVDEQQKALQSPLDMEAVKISSMEQMPQVVDAPPLSSDIYRDIQLLQHDWQVITGQTGARMGGAEGETATENIFIERAANLRDAELQGKVQAWLATAGRKMWQLVKRTMTLDMMVKLRGFDDQEFQRYVEERYGVNVQQLMQLPGLKDMFREQYGREEWLRVTREDIAFEADVSVVPGSQRPQTLEAEKRSAMEFLTVIGANPQLALSRGLMLWIGGMHDPPIPMAVIDELHALAKTMIQVNAKQAGREQGGANGNAGGAADPLVGMNPMMQAMGNGGV